jgi:hypothetical protein
MTFFGGQKKNSEFTTDVFCEFGFFFLPKEKNVLRWEKSSPCWVSGPPKSSKSARIGSEKKIAEVGHSH